MLGRGWRAAVVLVALALPPALAVPGIALPTAPPASAEVVGDGADLYPTFPVASQLLVVEAPPGSLPPGEMLALVTLQGLVNRATVRLYVDDGGGPEAPSSMLPFLQSHYGLALRIVSPEEAFALFPNEAKGLVVYDPDRPATINLATTYAGLEDLVATDPSFGARLRAGRGLAVVRDLRDAPWRGLDDRGLVAWSLDQLYDRVDHRRLAILPPNHFGIRDYSVATRTFVFYLPQGPLQDPWTVAATDAVLARFPQGISILGWFDTPTRAEENFFVQRSSRYGKVVLGGEDLLDLTVLTSLGRASRLRMGAFPTGVPLADNLYVAFAVPDGDNLDFLNGKMRQLWAEPARGTLPMAWTVNPLLVDLAPPLLEYYNTTRTAGDAFVAGPSGGGYIYPGFASPQALAAHLDRTHRTMEATGLDEVWLLNTFPPYEVQYPSAVIGAYEAFLHPRALILDYGDMATTRDYWMATGGGQASPVIRTTHMWGTPGNFVGKVWAEEAALAPGPHFVLAAVYPWSYGPSDARAMVQTLRSRFGNRVVPVSTADLFDLVERQFLKQARDLGRGGRDPATEGLVQRAEAAAALGDTTGAGYYGYAAVEKGATARGMSEAAMVLGVGGGMALLLLVAVPRARPRRALGAPWDIASVALVTLGFVAATRGVLEGNFWDYYILGVGVGAGLVTLVAAGAAPAALMARLGPPVAAFALALLPLSPWAFVPVAVGTALALAARTPGTGAQGLVLGSMVGLGISLLPLPGAGTAVPGLVLAAALLPRRASPPPWAKPPTTAHRPSPALTALVATLPMAMLPVEGVHFIYLRLGPLPATGLPTSALFLGLAISLAVAFLAHVGPRNPAAVALGTAGAWVALFGVQDALLAAFILTAALALHVYLALVVAARVGPAGTHLVAWWMVLAVVAPLLGLLPGVTYALVLPLPASVEFVAYASPLLLALVALALALLLARGRARTPA